MRRLIPALAVVAACATSAPRQTEIMKDAGATVSAEALRIRLRALAPPTTARIEKAADGIVAGTPDPAVQRRALIWKINAVAALNQAFYSQQPGVGLADAWALLVQFEEFLETPEGRAAFGPGVAEALAATRDVEARVVETYRWAVPDRDPALLRARLVEWSRAHPIEGYLSTRRSLQEDLAGRMTSDELSVFQAAAVAAEDLRGIIARMDHLSTALPKQAIWEAELAFQDLGAPRLEQVLQRADQALARLDHVIAWLGGPGLEGLADRERQAILDGVTQQRLAIASLIDVERKELTRFVTQERAQILDDVNRMRVAAAGDVERLTRQATEDASRKATELVDRILLRVALILAGAILLWGAVAYGVRQGARRSASPPPGS
jgi:hypothetical protein